MRSEGGAVFLSNMQRQEPMYRHICIVSALIVPLTSVAAQNSFGPRPAITVMPFEFGAVSSYDVSRGRRGPYPGPHTSHEREQEVAIEIMQTIGVGVADLLVEKLVESERFRVYERRHLEAVQREQSLQADEADEVERARYVVTGSISFLGHGDQDIGTLLAGAASGMLKIGAASIRTSGTTMRVTARVVDTRTGEIIGSATGQGKSNKRIGGSILALAGRGLLATSMTNSNFRESAIGEAADRGGEGRQRASHRHAGAATSSLRWRHEHGDVSLRHHASTDVWRSVDDRPCDGRLRCGDCVARYVRRHVAKRIGHNDRQRIRHNDRQGEAAGDACRHIHRCRPAQGGNENT
jgi:curli biogenesis system outer membrane secretion channel CsgG